jgi:hypothetical protein
VLLFVSDYSSLMSVYNLMNADLDVGNLRDTVLGSRNLITVLHYHWMHFPWQAIPSCKGSCCRPVIPSFGYQG